MIEKEKKGDIYVPRLTFLANEIKKKDIDEERQVLVDITDEVWRDFEGRIAMHKLIVTQVLGEVSSSKSTVGSTIANKLNFEKPFLSRKKDIEMDKLILMDIVEFLRFKNQGHKNLCLVIDESGNPLNKSYYSGSTIDQEYVAYSDVFAQNFLHRISCSPSMISDRNCHLILEVIGVNQEEKVTKLKVKHRDVVTGDLTILGHMMINVGETIKQAWYNRYRQKKFLRMELLKTYGYRDIRDCERGVIALRVYNRLRELTKSMRPAEALILATCQEEYGNMGILNSIIADSEIGRRASTILGLEYQVNKAEEKLEKMRYKENINPETITNFEKALETMKKILQDRINYEKRCIEIYELYFDMKGTENTKELIERVNRLAGETAVNKENK